MGCFCYVYTWRVYFSSDVILVNSLRKSLPEKWIALLCNYCHFWHKRDPKGGNFRILIFLIFHQILMYFFAVMIISLGYWWTINNLLFYFEKWSNGPNFLEVTWNSKSRQMSKIQWVQQITVSRILPCPTHYCVQQFIMSSKILCPHFLLRWYHTLQVKFDLLV